MSIRVLPSTGVENGRKYSVIILICIKYVPLNPSLSPALRPTFSQVDYEGNEGPDRGSNLPASPCNVLVRLEGTIIEEDLTIRLIPQTFPENIAINGPLSTACAEHLGFNASSKNNYVTIILQQIFT